MTRYADIADQQELLKIHRRNLQHLLKQEAVHGINTPSAIASGIDTARAQIARIKGILRGWAVAVEDHPDDLQIVTEIGPGSCIGVAFPYLAAETLFFRIKAKNARGFVGSILNGEGEVVAHIVTVATVHYLNGRAFILAEDIHIEL